MSPFETATRAYAAARMRLGVGAGAAVALVPLGSLALGGRALNALMLGAALTTLLGALVWRGQQAARGGMTGLKAGLVPLAFAHAANLYGHVCIPGQGCTSLCVPACATGGVVAGLLVERFARTAGRPNVVRACGSAVAFLTGALGCACVGSAGLLGLMVGMGCTLAAGRLFAPRPA
jgi:hypothetical protein